MLRLSIHSDSEDSKITPVRGMENSEGGSVYDTKQLKDKNTKGGYLPIPETVSVYVQRWLIWVKSIYEKEHSKVVAAHTHSYFA